MMQRLSSVLLSVFIVTTLTLTVPVFAYEVTEDPDTGEEVYQPRSCFLFSVNENGSSTIFLNDLLPIIRDSFDAWEEVTCSYFYFEETALTSVESAEFNQDKGNVNLLVWREEAEDWPPEFSNNAIAMTTVTYDLDSYEILDADIEFNGAYFGFGTVEDSNGTTTSDFVDLQTVITHEIGHTIGLDDLYGAEHVESTMHGAAIHESDGTPSIDKRTLAQDDMDGLCYLYPENEDPDSCVEPVCGLDLDGTTTSCKVDSSDGCQTVSTGLRQPTSLITRLLQLL